MRYEVIEKTSLKDFEIEIEKRIDDGWCTQGGVSVIQDEDYCCTYFQAMTTNNMSYKPASKR
jgi:hypothetical protein